MTEKNLGGPGERFAIPRRSDVFKGIPRNRDDVRGSNPKDAQAEADDRAWANRFPLASRKRQEDQTMIAGIELKRARAAWLQAHPGQKLPAELQEGGTV
jgi:hypothetical protein